MKFNKNSKVYKYYQEKWNVATHAIGIAFSILGLIVLLTKSIIMGSSKFFISYLIFGLSLIVLYSASTFYHRECEPLARKLLRVFDHSSIYILIAGTYTPFTILVLGQTNGIILFSIIWSCAILGIIFKLFFTEKLKIFSTIMYVLMGWTAIFFIKPLSVSLKTGQFVFLVLGGLMYTVGALLYLNKKVMFNHAKFHIFVLLGSFFHFLTVLTI